MDVAIIRLILVAIAGFFLLRQVRQSRGTIQRQFDQGTREAPGPALPSRIVRAQRYRNGAYTSATIGILSMLAWMAVRSPAWLGPWFRALGITAIVVGFVLGGVAGWISAGADP